MTRHASLFTLLGTLLLAAPGAAFASSGGALKITKPAKMKLYYLDLRKIQVVGPDKIIATMRQAAAAGYKSASLSDNNFERLALKDKAYFAALKKVAAAARELGLEIAPNVGSLGHGTPFLKNDPNLAEAIRVLDAPFRVRGGKAVAWLEPETRIRGGDFERFKGNTFARIRGQDRPGDVTFVDRTVKASGRASCRLEAKPGYQVARAKFTITVKPWRAYRLFFKLKTKGLKGSFRLEVDGKEGLLSRQSPQPSIRSMQDWKAHNILFNSWDNTELKIDIGFWGFTVKAGTAWLDDLRIEPAGLLNVLRRPGCPVSVKGADGTVFEEGKDYAPIQEPKLNPTDTTHAPPTIVIPKGSRIKDGQTVYVSHYAPLLVRAHLLSVCLSEPKVWKIIEYNLRKLKEVFAPREYLWSFDEVRMINQCHACRSRGLTSGQLLAATARKFYATVKKVDPQAEVIVWSDMFDPLHNALRKNYYYVPGTCDKSWEGLPGGMIIGNWARSGARMGKSQEFFARRGHRQILCGYYGDTKHIKLWLKRCAKVPGITGVMFCKYAGSFKDLKPFADNVRGVKPPPK